LLTSLLLLATFAATVVPADCCCFHSLLLSLLLLALLHAIPTCAAGYPTLAVVGTGIFLLLVYNRFADVASYAGMFAFAANLAVVTTHWSIRVMEQSARHDLRSDGCLYPSSCYCSSCTDKKENKIFLIYKEIQSGAVAKSYMR
jgi:hypothetical protein